MPITIEEKANRIIADIQLETGCSPVRIFKSMAKKDYVNIHGPEHHILDGACILTAFYNAGGDIYLDMGAALSIIDGTGPLSDDGSWGEHMKFTSEATRELGRINGPRCCKRDAMIAFRKGVEYINEHYNVTLEYEEQVCEFSDKNQQCIKEKCPFYRKGCRSTSKPETDVRQ